MIYNGDAAMLVKIGRSSGPVTDLVAETEFSDAEIDIVKDTIACINKVSRLKEGWYVEIDGIRSVPYPKVNNGSGSKHDQG